MQETSNRRATEERVNAANSAAQRLAQEKEDAERQAENAKQKVSSPVREYSGTAQ